MPYGDLATLDAVTAYLTIGGNGPPSSDDTVLSSLITSASDFIHRVCYRFFPLADYAETRDGTGGKTLLFANTPAQAVSSLTIDGHTIPFSSNGFAFGYSWDPTAITLRGWYFFRRQQNVVINYTAGFPTIPPAAAQACIELVAARYIDRGHIGVASENIPDIRQVTYRLEDMLPSTQSALSALAQKTAIIPYISQFAATQTDSGLLAVAI